MPVSAVTESAALPPILGALDDKIELNRRMNETLEAMARAIFKDWFVDFGPTRAKMEGRAPYLAPDIWALFPDRFDDDGKPEGWPTPFARKYGSRVPAISLQEARRTGLRHSSIPALDLGKNSARPDWLETQQTLSVGVLHSKRNPGSAYWRPNDSPDTAIVVATGDFVIDSLRAPAGQLLVGYFHDLG